MSKVVRLHPNQEVFPRANNWWDRWHKGTGLTVPISLRVNKNKTGPKPRYAI